MKTYLAQQQSQVPAGAQYFRLLPGYTCTDSGSGASVASHAGSIIHQNGILNYYPSQCSAVPQTIGGVPISAYNQDFFVYLNGIFEREASAPDPATAPAYNKVFCRNSADLIEGTDVVIKKRVGSQPGANLFVNGANLTQTEWANYYFASVSPTQLTGPDGKSAVFKLTEDVGGNFHSFGQNVSGLPDRGIYVFSVWAKSAGRYIALNIRGKDNIYYRCGFDIVNEALLNCGTGTGKNPLAAGLEKYPDGWYRVWVRYDVMAGSQPAYLYFELDQAQPNTPDYPGDGVSGVFLADAKLESALLPGPIGPYAAQIFRGQRDSDGVYRARRVSSFEVGENATAVGRTFGSDVFRFDLAIQGVGLGAPLGARLRTTIDQSDLDLNMNCWVERD